MFDTDVKIYENRLTCNSTGGCGKRLITILPLGEQLPMRGSFA
jgi:hypothetical protein